MFSNLIILTALLSAGFHSTTSYTAPFQVLGVQQISPIPTFEEQMAIWSSHQPVDNFVHNSDEGLPLHLQQNGATANFDKEQQTNAQSGGVDKVNQQEQHLTLPALTPAVVEPSHEDAAKVEEYPGYFAPFYDDQVTVFPQMDESYSDSEEQEVWPPVGIYPPPPPPPVRPTYFPPYYPTQYPVTKPPPRPTTTRPRPPSYPSLYPEYPTSRPKPPYYPQYPLEPLPQLPQYTTTQRPPYVTTTPIYPKPGGEDVAVLENYQVISEKGIKEYKLRLSNGLTDYKKITKKNVGKKTIYVQTGYYSVPVDPTKNKFNLIHYIADERGYRVTGVQSCSNVHPCKVLNE